MDADKLNEAAENHFMTAIPYYHCSDTVRSCVINAFRASVNWLMQQPIADRLTEEEKERIIMRYNDELKMALHHTLKMKKSSDPSSRQFHANVREGYISRIKLLQQIFGKELFNEK